MNIDELKKPVIKKENVTFKFYKLPAVEGLDLFEDIRVAFGRALDSVTPTENLLLTLSKALTAIPADFSKHLREKLFAYIEFTRDGDTATPKLTAEWWPSAFEHLDAADVYELMLRALVINFFSSYKKLERLRMLM